MKNIDRFMAHIMPEPNSGCWLWLGGTFQTIGRTMGYGRFGHHGVLAHRLSWEIHRGPPGSAMVCHTCDNHICVNPDHLYLGTAATNMADKVARGRQARGSQIRQTVLTQAQARRIKQNPNIPLTALAREFGVAHAVVWHVRVGNSWKWA